MVKMLQGFNLKKAGRYLRAGWNKNNQKILAVVAGACAIGAVVEAIRATPKANQIAEARRDELEDLSIRLQEEEINSEEHQKLVKETNFRAAKEFALCYGTTMCLLILSVGSTACNYKISIGKQAALLGAYKALEAKSDEIMAKAKDIVGEKKVNEIKSAVVKDHLDKAEIPEHIKAEEYAYDKDGKPEAKPYRYPCWLEDTEDAFTSNVSEIEQCMTRASSICFANDAITMNQIYELLDPSGRDLRPSRYGATHGFLSSDLDRHVKQIPYHLVPVFKEGYSHSFTALVFDKDPILLDYGD